MSSTVALLAPTAALPSLRSASVLEDSIHAALDKLVSLYCPLPSALIFHTSQKCERLAPPAPQPPLADSGYASGVEDGDDGGDEGSTDCSVSALAALRADTFERSFAERWLTTFIARSEELDFSSEDARQLAVDKAACVLTSFHEPVDEDPDDEGVTRRLSFQLPTRFGPGATIEIQLNDGSVNSTDHTDVGLQSWGASMVFSELICAMPDSFGLIPDDLGPSPCVIELGAGTGLVSLAMSRLLPRLGIPTARIVATDYHHAVLDNLRSNIRTNYSDCRFEDDDTPAVQACHLDWSAPSFTPPLDKPAQLLVATDVIYAPEHAKWLRDCAATMLAVDGAFWLMATVRRAGKFEGISDTVQAVFSAAGCPRLSDDNTKVLKILTEQDLDRPRGIGHGDESGYKLFRIGWA